MTKLDLAFNLQGGTDDENGAMALGCDGGRGGGWNRYG
jgi:hypothetical protein